MNDPYQMNIHFQPATVDRLFDRLLQMPIQWQWKLESGFIWATDPNEMEVEIKFSMNHDVSSQTPIQN